MTITTHRRFIDADFPAALSNQSFQLPPHDGDERLRNSESVRIVLIWDEAPAESIWTRHTGLEIYAAKERSFSDVEIPPRPLGHGAPPTAR